MSDDNDKIRSNYIAVDMVSNSEKNRVAKSVSNGQNIFDSVSKNDLSIEVVTEVTKAMPCNQISSDSENNITVSKNMQVYNSQLQKTVPNIREQMITKTILFLRDKKVKLLPMDQQIHILRINGVTEPDIIESFFRESRYNTKQHPYSLNLPYGYNNLSNTSYTIQTSHEPHNWFGRLIGKLTIYSTVAYYIGYQTYTKCIKKWLFTKPKSSSENHLAEVKLNLLKLEKEIQRTTLIFAQCADFDHQKLLDIQAEVKVIKNIFINRFPSVATSLQPTRIAVTKTAKPAVV